MHDIVTRSCILNVSTINYHRVLDLLGPCLVVHSHAVHVGIGHQKQLVHHAVKLIVVGDRHRCPLQFAQCAAVVDLVELYLKVLVLLVLHVVYDGYNDVALGLPVLELQHTLATLEVLAVDGSLVHRSPLHVHLAVSSVLPRLGANQNISLHTNYKHIRPHSFIFTLSLYKFLSAYF